MVGVFMGIEDRVNDPDFLSQQLLTKIGRAIDQQVSFGQSQDHTASSAAVTRVFAGANFAATANRRNADRGAGSQKDHLAGNVTTNGCMGHVVLSFRFSVAG